MKVYRTILHGTCLMGGRHEPGSQLARECPLLRAKKRRGMGDQGVDTGSSEIRSPESLSDAGFDSEFRDADSDLELPLLRARRPVGRRASTDPSRHARYRRRHPEYRAREAARKSRSARATASTRRATAKHPVSLEIPRVCPDEALGDDPARFLT
jgi:hypothetical protein